MTADDHLREGNLEAARAELIATVKRAPADQGARMFLFQLLCVNGEWDKAAAQLRTLASLSPEAQMLSTAYGQAIEAEKTRAAAFAGRGDFPILAGEEAWTADLAASLSAFARGDAADGEARRDAAFDAAPDCAGTADGRAFAWIADADPRFGPTVEAIVHGRWGLLPFSAVEHIAFEPARDLRDLVWLPVQFRLRTGLSAAGFLPTRYPGSEAGDAAIQLARETRWTGAAAGDIGLGQRLLAFDDGDEAGLLSLRRITFA